MSWRERGFHLAARHDSETSRRQDWATLLPPDSLRPHQRRTEHYEHLFWIILLRRVVACLTTSIASAQTDHVHTRDQPVQEIFQPGLVYTQERGQLSYTSRFSGCPGSEQV